MKFYPKEITMLEIHLSQIQEMLKNLSPQLREPILFGVEVRKQREALFSFHEDYFSFGMEDEILKIYFDKDKGEDIISFKMAYYLIKEWNEVKRNINEKLLNWGKIYNYLSIFKL